MQILRSSHDVFVGLVTHSAYEAVALHYHVDGLRHENLHTAEEGMDVYLLVLVDDSLTQIESDSAEAGI